MIIFFQTNMIDGGSPSDAPSASTATHVANWISPTFGLYSLTLFFVGWFKWP